MDTTSRFSVGALVFTKAFALLFSDVIGIYIGGRMWRFGEHEGKLVLKVFKAGGQEVELPAPTAKVSETDNTLKWANILPRETGLPVTSHDELLKMLGVDVDALMMR